MAAFSERKEIITEYSLPDTHSKTHNDCRFLLCFVVVKVSSERSRNKDRVWNGLEVHSLSSAEFVTTKE